MGNSLSGQAVRSWSDTCAATVQQHFAENCSPNNVGLLYGNRTYWAPPANASTMMPCPVSFPNTSIHDVWGVDKATCDRFCSSKDFYQALVFQDFATASANWLLPWLALFAQLPYEAAGTRDNLMSCIIAVGSPALLGYSFAFTALNRWQIRIRFQRLIDSKAKRVRDYVPFMEERLEAACQLLQEALQCPLRLTNESGWLSSLILLPQNSRFWLATIKSLKATRRRATPSLLAQTTLAIVAYFFTFFSSIAEPGSTIIGLQFALSTGFTWLFTAMFGVLFVSSQLKVFAVKDSLDEPEVSDGDYRTYRAIQTGVVVNGRQKGIRSRTGLNSLVRYAGAPIVNGTDQEQGYLLSSFSATGNSVTASQVPVVDITDATRPSTPANQSAGSLSISEHRYPLPPGAAPSSPDSRPGIRPLQDSPEPLVVPLPTASTGLGLSSTGSLMTYSRRARTSTDRLLPAPATINDSDPFEYFTPPPVPAFLFWRLEGDERKEGPLYNYARIFTAAQKLRQLEHGFSSALTALRAGTGRPERTVSGQAYDLQVRPMPEAALSGNTLQMATFTDLPPPHEPERPYLMAAYIGFRQMPMTLLQNFLSATIFGLATFWTAVGAGIYVSYNTPDVGLGCRSGSLLLYGVLGTMSFFLLVGSSILSHATMLRYQKIFREDPEEISKRKAEPWRGFASSYSLILLECITVFTRVLGKLFAAVSAGWLLVCCCLQLAGYFDQCWCQAVALSKGDKGMVLLWRTQAQLANVAKKIWITTFVWSILLPLAAATWLAALSRKAERRQ